MGHLLHNPVFDPYSGEGFAALRSAISECKVWALCAFRGSDGYETWAFDPLSRQTPVLRPVHARLLAC